MGSSCQFQDLLSSMSDDPSWMKNVLKSKSFCIKRLLAIIKKRNSSQVIVRNESKNGVDLIGQQFLAREVLQVEGILVFSDYIFCVTSTLMKKHHVLQRISQQIEVC